MFQPLSDGGRLETSLAAPPPANSALGQPIRPNGPAPALGNANRPAQGLLAATLVQIAERQFGTIAQCREHEDLSGKSAKKARRWGNLMTAKYFYFFIQLLFYGIFW